MGPPSSKCRGPSTGSSGAVCSATRSIKYTCTNLRSGCTLGSLHSLWTPHFRQRRALRAFDGAHASGLLDYLPAAAAVGVLGLLAAALRPSLRPHVFATEGAGNSHVYTAACYAAAVSTVGSGPSSEDGDPASSTHALQDMPMVVVSAVVESDSSSSGMLSDDDSQEEHQLQQLEPQHMAAEVQQYDGMQQHDDGKQQQQEEEDEAEDDNQLVDPEAVRLMVAATILARESSQDTDGLLSYASADGEDDLDPRAMALLEDVATVNEDSLAVAVGVLRQHCSDTDDCALSERLHRLLQLLDQRPGPEDAAAPANARAGAMATVADSLSAAPDSFWSVADEWADIRSALCDIGIEALRDDSDTEMEGAAQAVSALRRLDATGAAKLAAFLQELQQRRGQQGDAADGKPLAASSAESSIEGEASAEVEAEARWWESVVGAYDLLWAQAIAQQQQQQQQAVV